MRLLCIFLMSFALFAEPAYADPGKGKGKGKGAEKGKGKGKGKGNSYKRGEEKHKEATSVISAVIANETGLPAQNYERYSSNLADTLGYLEPEALLRVFEGNLGSLP